MRCCNAHERKEQFLLMPTDFPNGRINVSRKTQSERTNYLVRAFVQKKAGKIISPDTRKSQRKSQIMIHQWATNYRMGCTLLWGVAAQLADTLDTLFTTIWPAAFRAPTTNYSLKPYRLHISPNSPQCSGMSISYAPP
jgi:hypothetical protein